MAAPGPWQEPVPYPRYSPPAQHSPPVRPHPYADAQNQSYYAPAMRAPAMPMPGFYNPALPQPQPGPTALRSSNNGPFAFPEPRFGLPPSLMPGRSSGYAVPRSHSSDICFQNQPYGFPRHSLAEPPPPLPRKPDIEQQPPLPPKPPLPPSHHKSTDSSARSFDAGSYFASPPHNHTISVSPNHLSNRRSASPMDRIRDGHAQASSQPMLTEEEQIVRALEESMKISTSLSLASSPRDRKSALLSASPEQSSITLPNVTRSDPNLASLRLARTGQMSQNAGVAEQISADEALARQLQEFEEDDPLRAQFPTPVNEEATPHLEHDLPQYDDVVSSPPLSTSASYNPFALSSDLSIDGTGLDDASSRPGSSSGGSLHRSISEKPISPQDTRPDQGRGMGRSQSVGIGQSFSNAATPANAPQALHSPSERPLLRTLVENLAPDPPGSPSHSVEVMTNTQYLDTELLAGLSLGFGTPSIGQSLKNFNGVIPNVIALPYGRCPPFHIMAPSWRNLLKLIARLSGTRLEPTMEALTVIKTEMKLRVVVSFVKVHQASTNWHTVLYMTIDHPVPANAPIVWKYRNTGDTSILPFSYTLSQLPAFLRDGADTPLSKYYTVPASFEVPHPTLPMSFPDLATYLATALENARDAMRDSSSGVRRLAQYVDQFYPNDRMAFDDTPERVGMRRRLKKFVGIGSKPQRDRNAEVYELVTPFVPDDYGR